MDATYTDDIDGVSKFALDRRTNPHTRTDLGREHRTFSRRVKRIFDREIVLSATHIQKNGMTAPRRATASTPLLDL